MSTLVVPLFLALFLLQLCVEAGLALLDLGRARRAGDAVPAPLAGVLAPETARRSREYAVARGRVGVVHQLYDGAVTLLLLFSGALPALDGWLAGRGLAGPNRFAAFMVALAAAGSLADLPFSLYGTFAVERRFGFNRATPGLWVKDRLRGVGLSAAVGVPILYAAYGLFALAGRAWWLWLFAFLAAVQLLLDWLYPAVLAPIFNRFTPLPEGALRARLEALAREARFRTRGLFVVDASRRSGHSNAYFAGLFRPRIVLFDTLVAEMSVEETAAVLAHEIGHYQARHVHRRLAVALAMQLAALAALSRLVAWPPLFAAFGFPAPSLQAAVALVALCGGAFTFFLAPLANAVSRRQERAADRYSLAVARAPAALRSALLRLHGQNLSNPDPHPWYSAWYHSHPPLQERLAAIEAAGAAAIGSLSPRPSPRQRGEGDELDDGGDRLP